MHNILSKWYIYLASFAVTTTAFCVATSIKTNPKETERINFVLGSYDADVTDLEKTLNKQRIDGIKNIRCSFLKLGSKNFNYLYSSMRGDSDFFILPIVYLENSFVGATDYAANIKTEYVDEMIGSSQTYYSVGDYVKGIKIYDSKTESGILKEYITYIEGEEKSDYYLFFTFNSKNIGELNNSKTDNAFKVIRKMITL